MGGGFRSWSTEMEDLQRKYPMIKPVRNVRAGGREENEGKGLTQPLR
jgi:hypothetical protein